MVAMLRRRHPEPPALRRLGCHHRAICATELGRAVKPRGARGVPAAGSQPEGSQQRGGGGDLAASFARDGYLFLPAACGAADCRALRRDIDDAVLRRRRKVTDDHAPTQYASLAALAANPAVLGALAALMPRGSCAMQHVQCDRHAPGLEELGW